MEKGIVMSFNDAAAFDALRLLHESKYNSNEALAGMVALPPHKSSIVKWAEEEKRLFEQGIKQFGKHFDKIRREYLPKKNTKEIVEYYYLWKMTPAALNIRYAKKKGSRNNGMPCSKRPKLSADNASSDPGEGSSGSDSPGSESEESNAEDGELVGRDDLTCEHCKTKSSERWRYGGSNKMVLCSPCRLHFKRFGEMPPLSESSLSESSLPGSVKNGGSESETNKSVENNLDGNRAETEKEAAQHGTAPEDEEKDQSGDLLIDDDEEATPVDVEEEQPEEDEEEMVDTEAKEEPNKFMTVKFGQNQITFTRPSCRGWDKCSRTDMVYMRREEAKKDTPPVAKAERTPIKQEPAPQIYGPGHPGFSPLITPGTTGMPGMPGSSLISNPAAAAASAGVISANGIFNGPQLSTSVSIKPDPMPKIEPGSYAQAKIMELFKAQEAAAKMKMQAEGLYNMPHGLRPPSMAPPSLLPNFPGIRPPSGFDNKMLQGMHSQLQHEQLMEHLEALSRQQAQHQQAVAAQQHMQAQQQHQQQQFSAERIQELLKNARTVPDKYLQEQLLEAARSDALARQQQAAAAAHLLPQTPDNPQQASQWARFIEQQAMAAAQQQHNAAAAAAQHNQAPHGAPPRGYEGLSGSMASALQHHHQQQQQQQQQQQAQLHQQRPQLPHIHQHDKRKRDTPFPFHQLFPIMARRHTVKKHECKLKGEDDEIIFMGSNGGPPHVPTRTLPSHLPAHLSQLSSGVKPSFSPLQSAPHRLPNGSGLPSSQHQLPAGLIPGMSSAHYANLMKVFQNQNILRNQLQ
ncbi:hypothetical protein ACHWQZ_G006626 [Mnemiopsis leidyi]